MITGERAGFLQYPAVTVDIFIKASAAASTEESEVMENKGRGEETEKAAMADQADSTQRR